MANTYLLNSSTGKGAKLAEQLIKELDIPGSVTDFSVSFSIGEPVIVSCTYMPAEKASDAE